MKTKNEKIEIAKVIIRLFSIGKFSLKESAIVLISILKANMDLQKEGL